MRFALPTRAAIGFAFHLTQRRLLVRVAWEGRAELIAADEAAWGMGRRGERFALPIPRSKKRMDSGGRASHNRGENMGLPESIE